MENEDSELIDEIKNPTIYKMDKATSNFQNDVTFNV